MVKEIIRDCVELKAFSKRFPIVLRRTIGQYDLGELNMDLLGLRIITVVEILKWDSQYPKSIQVLVIFKNLKIHSLFLMIDLMWLQINLLRPGADKLLHFSIALISSCLENKSQLFIDLLELLSRTWRSTSLVKEVV